MGLYGMVVNVTSDSSQDNSQNIKAIAETNVNINLLNFFIYSLSLSYFLIK